MSFFARTRNRFRRAWPDKVVRREIQGVSLVMPRSHRLPDYTQQFATYGQNLVAIAEVIAQRESAGFAMVDVGANIGDSALQVLAKVDVRVLCVEGDEYWLKFLHLNVDPDPRIRVVPALLLPDETSSTLTAVRRDGSSHFVEGGTGLDAATAMTPAELREQAAGFGRVRLVKSDTDGYDARIVPAIAAQWASEHPVVFFEFFPELIRAVGDDEPERVWAALSALGYEHVVVWDNFGVGLGALPIGDVATASRVLDEPREARSYDYWDVAVVHHDDANLRAPLDALVGNRSFGGSA